MPRDFVQNADVRSLREKLEAFGRRQSETQVSGNPRKRRSSQTWEDIQREEMQFTEQWKDEVAFYPNKRRSIIPPQDCNKISMNEITDFSLPSPVSSMTSPSPAMANRPALRTRMTRDLSFTEYRETGRNAVREIKGVDQVLPSIETDDVDMPSFGPDTPSPWGSEPRTPEGPYTEEDVSKANPGSFIDVGLLVNAEQNLLAAFGPQQAPTTIFNAKFYAETIPGFDTTEKSQTIGADFEAAFEEFMNVS